MTKTKSFSRSVAAPASAPKRFRFDDLIAIVVVAAIGFFAVQHFSAANGAAQQQEGVKTFITHDLDAALMAYKNDTGAFPSTRQGLKALVEQPDNVSNWKGPYLSADALKDTWNISYQYAFPGRHSGMGKFDVWSMGPDKMSGTADDIGNW
jgi:general secretion pathway protein G